MMETRSPTSPQRSHIKNGTVVPGAGSTTNLGARSERSRSAKRTPTKFAPGGIELIPQPSSMPADPLVCSIAAIREDPVLTREAELVRGEERMHVCLINVRLGTHLHFENDVRYRQCSHRHRTERHIPSSSSTNRCAIYIWRTGCIERPRSKSVLWEERTLPSELDHCVACYGVEHAYHC
jgi:hypothetical protein